MNMKTAIATGTLSLATLLGGCTLGGISSPSATKTTAPEIKYENNEAVNKVRTLGNTLLDAIADGDVSRNDNALAGKVISEASTISPSRESDKKELADVVTLAKLMQSNGADNISARAVIRAKLLGDNADREYFTIDLKQNTLDGYVSMFNVDKKTAESKVDDEFVDTNVKYINLDTWNNITKNGLRVPVDSATGSYVIALRAMFGENKSIYTTSGLPVYLADMEKWAADDKIEAIYLDLATSEKINVNEATQKQAEVVKSYNK